jgi:flagellar assembly factor FliW
MDTMQINTTRFGKLTIDPDGILLFPEGVIGFESHRHWVLLRDEHEQVGWLQSLHTAETALPVVIPSQYVPDYQLRFRRQELATIPWSPMDEAVVLSVLSRNETGDLTLNLRAPVLINLQRGLGRQILTCDDQPVQYVLSTRQAPLRKSA